MSLLNKKKSKKKSVKKAAPEQAAAETAAEEASAEGEAVAETPAKKKAKKSAKDKKKGKGEKKPKGEKRPRVKREGNSATDAAELVFKKNGNKPLNLRDLMDAIEKNGFHKPRKENWPRQSLSSALQREINNGDEPRFMRAGKGQFKLKKSAA